jgi:RNA polymerase sigma-70 factor (ECF subfamily)
MTGSARDPLSSTMPFDGTTDEAIMELVHQGDALALRQLMVRYWQPLVAYARKILGDHDTAADMAQYTFIKVWQARAQWTPSGKVSAYIFRIARNAVANELRSRRSQSQLREGCSADNSSTPWNPLELLEEKELRSALELALERLPPRRREIYMLARDRGLSHVEISAIMGISPQTVANQMTSAIADLRRHLADILDKR